MATRYPLDRTVNEPKIRPVFVLVNEDQRWDNAQEGTKNEVPV
jgi:hypothetical protein